jgi:putative acetyltransferase
VKDEGQGMIREAASQTVGVQQVVAQESPLTADLELLFQRHTADMHADTPPESIHMIPREELAVPGIDFLVMRQNGTPVAMGAMKHLGQGEAELKSMHVLAEHRGQGLSRLLLTRLLDHARDQGITRLSLETGVQPTFVSARALYLRAGFVECPPFADYKPDPNSVFMTLLL